jgi:hypothetical protein
MIDLKIEPKSSENRFELEDVSSVGNVSCGEQFYQFADLYNGLCTDT